jgi:hypothetical protein
VLASTSGEDFSGISQILNPSHCDPGERTAADYLIHVAKRLLPAAVGVADGVPDRAMTVQGGEVQVLRRRLRSHRERPRHRRGAQRSYQFPPSDGDSHAPLPREGA